MVDLVQSAKAIELMGWCSSYRIVTEVYGGVYSQLFKGFVSQQQPEALQYCSSGCCLWAGDFRFPCKGLVQAF